MNEKSSLERPAFIYPGGSVLMHSPLQLGNAEMYGFFINGDLAKLQRSIDETLNRVAAGRMSFKVLSPYVMLTFTRVNHANSAYPPDRAKGWGKETDIVTWIMVGQMKDAGGQEKLERVFSYPFHIWVDDAMALINGRELYGYPKYACEYTMPQSDADPERFTLAAKGFQPFSETTELAMHPLLEVTAVEQGQAHRPVAGFLELTREALAIFRSQPDFFDRDLVGWEDLAGMLMKPHVDQIFLKQFPDRDGVKAVYQAIVTAPAQVNAVHSACLLGHRYQCTLHAFDSFPLNDTLGLQLGAQPVLLPFHINFDFTVTQGEELVDNSHVQREKIAILGGGVGAMSAALSLTDQPGWQDRYEITVYQIGWRLGGKGASGRNAAFGKRIEEHGLHIWFGFYDNAFAVMQRVYQELGRPAGAPLRTWQDAFKPQHFLALTEWIDGQWKLWPMDTPIKPGVPGHGNEEITAWQMAVTLYAWVKLWIEELHDEHLPKARAVPQPAAGERPRWLKGLAVKALREVEDLAADVKGMASAIKDWMHALSAELKARKEEDHGALAEMLAGARAWVSDAVVDRLKENDELRRLYISIDLALTALVGMLADRVFTRGFDAINDLDFRAWLKKHGANPATTLDCAPVRGFYDLVFAYEDGDFSRPNIEAGTMLRGILRIAVCYHGAIMWKMQAGMGDVVFTPLYEVLRRRGVKFKFFHKVEELVPGADGIEQVRITQQVALAKSGEYSPLVDIKGLPCWPSTPNYEQLDPAQAALLRAHNVNLESHWSDWPALYQQKFGLPLPSVTLRRGVDFDKVIFGISLGAMPAICAKLLQRNARLKAMTEKVKCVVTQAYQVWLSKALPELGWRVLAEDGQAPVVSAFTEPFDTWAPMDQLLVREDWPPDLMPKSVSYFCSAMPLSDFPPPTDYGFPARCAAEVKAGAIAQLNGAIASLWRAAVTKEGFQWSWLIDPNAGRGEQRFDGQFWRANIDPSELYVLCVVGSSAYRLRAEESGFGNLFLAGDWVKTGLNAGCVEAAVMAGMQTSRAICGYPKQIKGESDT